MNQVTFDALFPRATVEHRTAFSGMFNRNTTEFGLAGGRLRLPFFLAQIGHESAGLTILEERLNYQPQRLLAVFPKYIRSYAEAVQCAAEPERLAERVYCDRMGNGPEGSGDGYRYRGRGYLQLTGRDAYREIGGMVGLPLEERPELASSPEHALRCACAVWAWKQLNALADRGDFAAVTRRINGGLHGYRDRLAWLARVRRALSDDGHALRLDECRIARVQQALRARGYSEVGTIDGRVGPRTLSAVARFREQSGLGAGGIDARLLRALAVDRALALP